MRTRPVYGKAIAVALVAACALLAAGCGDESTGADAGDIETITVPPDTHAEPPSATAGEGTAIIQIDIENGRPVGGIERVTIAKGADVTMLVTSDVDDEIHVHGYDISKRVNGGETQNVDFRADIAGRFEVELEESGIQIAELTVEP